MIHRPIASPPSPLSVILHADDLGLNSAVTDGIFEGFRRGLLTSTSVLSNAPDADRALSLWQRLIVDFATGTLPSQPLRHRLNDSETPFDLGVHLNLTQGRPLTNEAYPRELLDRDGSFPGVFSLFSRLRSCRATTLEKVRIELSRQIEFVVERGLQPTHLNGHQYIEMLPAISAMLPELLDRYRIPSIRVAEEPLLFRSTILKGFSPARFALAKIKRYFARRFHVFVDRLGVSHADCFYGTAHAGQVDLDLMRLFLQRVKVECRSSVESPAKTIEIGLHPALESAGSLDTAWSDPLAASRPRELRLLTGPELAENLEHGHIRLGRLANRSAA